MSSTTAGLVVRRAFDHEGADVAGLWLASRRASVPQIPPPVHSDDEVIEWFATIVLPSREVWVIEATGHLVALMALDRGSIEQLYVHPDWTGRGLGSRLVRIAQNDHPRLQLWTFRANAGAKRFYERHGFVAVDSTEGDNEERAPGVRYDWRTGAEAAPSLGTEPPG